jgi:hypothetical protein
MLSFDRNTSFLQYNVEIFFEFFREPTLTLKHCKMLLKGFSFYTVNKYGVMIFKLKFKCR